MQKTNATAVSRKLRALGFAPVAPSDHNREGLKVRESYNCVAVSADFNSNAEAKALSAAAREALDEAGFRTERRTKGEPIFYVLGR